MTYRFYPIAAVDAVTGEPLKNVSGQLFDPADADRSTPLTVVNSAGQRVDVLDVDADGLTAEFVSDLPYLIWMAGYRAFPLVAPRAAVENASIAAEHPRSPDTPPRVQETPAHRALRIGRRGLLTGLATVKLASIASLADKPSVDVLDHLQSLLDSQPSGSTVFLDDPPEGARYYLSRQLTVPAGITLRGAAPRRQLRPNGKAQVGGVVFAPLPGTVFARGEAVIKCEGSRAQLQDVGVVADQQADYAVLDYSSDSVHQHLSTYGGLVCSYDGHRAARVRLEVPHIIGLGRPGAIAARIGQDSQMLGGTKNRGTLQLTNNHVQIIGAHLTGGGPNLEVLGSHGCQLSGCILDGASDDSMIRIRKRVQNFSATGVQFFQPQQPSTGQVPAVRVTGGGTSGLLSGCTVERGAHASRLPQFIVFGTSDPSGWNLATINANGHVIEMWDRRPGHFSGVRGPDGWLNSP